LGELFQKQAERFGAKVEFDMAHEVDFSQRPYKVVADSGEYLADTIIISTGASPVHLNIPGEEKLTGRGVSYCATCDGWFFKDKKVAIVGGGDSAFEEALFITRYASSVTLIHRRDEFRAGAILQNRAKDHPKMNFILNTVVTEIVGDDKLTTLKLKNVKTNEESTFDTDGLFIFIGHTPNTQMFEGKLEMSDLGYIIANDKMETSVPGVFAAGEVADPHFRQVITSAGMGAAAAIQATRYLEGRRKCPRRWSSFQLSKKRMNFPLHTTGWLLLSMWQNPRFKFSLNNRLAGSGSVFINRRDNWELTPKGCHYFQRQCHPFGIWVICLTFSIIFSSLRDCLHNGLSSAFLPNSTNGN
jgi:thioredoxin reductase (NADPH)